MWQAAEHVADDGESKLDDLVTLSRKLMSKSSSSGQEIILREVEQCKSEWSSLLSDISQVRIIDLIVMLVTVLKLLIKDITDKMMTSSVVHEFLIPESCTTSFYV